MCCARKSPPCESDGNSTCESSDIQKYVFFNELLYSIARPIYGINIKLNGIMIKAERKFRKKIMKNAKYRANSYYKSTKVLSAPL